VCALGLGSVAFMILCFPGQCHRGGEKASQCHKGPGSHIWRQLCWGCQGQRHQVHCFHLRWHRSLQLSCVLQRHGRRPCGGMQKGLPRYLRLRKKYETRDLRLGGRGGHGWRGRRVKQFLSPALFERRRARASEGQIERRENSSRCRSPPSHCTSSHTKYPTTITTMAMAVSPRASGAAQHRLVPGGEDGIHPD
jgi:hypothetical protein